MHVAIRYGSDGPSPAPGCFGARRDELERYLAQGYEARWKSCFILSRPRQPLMMKT